MILNRLIFPEGNSINFMLNHTENGNKYVLPQGGNYYIIISKPEEPFEQVAACTSENEYFNFTADLTAGEYIFEVGLNFADGTRTVILPALDERLRPMNQILILRRLNNG